MAQINNAVNFLKKRTSKETSGIRVGQQVQYQGAWWRVTAYRRTGEGFRYDLDGVSVFNVAVKNLDGKTLAKHRPKGIDKKKIS